MKSVVVCEVELLDINYNVFNKYIIWRCDEFIQVCVFEGIIDFVVCYQFVYIGVCYRVVFLYIFVILIYNFVNLKF